MADFMKTDAEAKQLLCPQMSTPEQTMRCSGSGCTLWCRERALSRSRRNRTFADEAKIYQMLDDAQAAQGKDFSNEEADAKAAQYALSFKDEPERPEDVLVHWKWKFLFDSENPFDFWGGWEESEKDAWQRELDTARGWCGLIRVADGERR